MSIAAISTEAGPRRTRRCDSDQQRSPARFTQAILRNRKATAGQR